MGKPKNVVLRDTTLNYLHTINPKDAKLPPPSKMEEDLLNLISKDFEVYHNAQVTKSSGEKKWKIPEELPPSVIAEIMFYMYHICRISFSGENADSDYDLLAIYQTDGKDKGIYTTSEDSFRIIARQYNYNLTKRDFEEIMLMLHDKAPRKTRCTDRDLIAVNNGIFNYSTKTLEPFSPDIVFLTKSHVDYNPNAVNPKYYNTDDKTTWDVESWISELSDDEEIVELIWQILGAIIRPNVRWGKSAWLYSETGNNGKGSLCELMRQLCGIGAYASISISDFSKDFMLEPLIRATAIIVDENDVGSYIDRAANLKAVITNDVIQINRKFKPPVDYQFYGFMVQCLNEFPRIRDKSNSFYRRQLFVPFNKCFTGQERKYIKDDYLHRKDVLEYVLYKVLNTNYYELSEPAACRNVLTEYKEFNDPVRQFWIEFKDQFVWNLLPFDFLYMLYSAWIRINIPNGGIQGKNTFVTDLLNIVDPNTDGWYCRGKNTRVRIGHFMDGPEPLIVKYNLSDWKNKKYTGNDLNKICTPDLATCYRGLIRTTRTIVSTVDDDIIDIEDIEDTESIENTDNVSD